MSHDMNPRDDERDEEEEFVLAIADLVQQGRVSVAKLHTRAYVDHVTKPPSGQSQTSDGAQRKTYQSHQLLDSMCMAIDNGFVCILDKGHDDNHFGETLATGHMWITAQPSGATSLARETALKLWDVLCKKIGESTEDRLPDWEETVCPLIQQAMNARALEEAKWWDGYPMIHSHNQHKRNPEHCLACKRIAELTRGQGQLT